MEWIKKVEGGNEEERCVFYREVMGWFDGLILRVREGKGW